jgi:predicted enzyme related to lactoylglutathione lyase
LAKDLQVNTEHGLSMTVFPHQEGDTSGCLYQAYDFTPNDSDLLIYFNVDKRINKAVAEVILHGGKVLDPVLSIGQWGYRAIILDCEGNKVALHAKIID